MAQKNHISRDQKRILSFGWISISLFYSALAAGQGMEEGMMVPIEEPKEDPPLFGSQSQDLHLTVQCLFCSSSSCRIGGWGWGCSIVQKNCMASDRKKSALLILAAFRWFSISLLVLSSSCIMQDRACRRRAVSPRLGRQKKNTGLEPEPK